MKKGGIIGKVIIEEVVGNVAKLNMDEFHKLSYEGVRVAGNGVSKSKFKRLKQAFIRTEGKVNTKYLIKQNRKFDRTTSGRSTRSRRFEKRLRMPRFIRLKHSTPQLQLGFEISTMVIYLEK